MADYKIFNNLFKYITIDKKLEGLKFSYFSLEEDTVDVLSNISTISPKIFNYEIKKEDIKSATFSKLDKLEENVFNFYIENGDYGNKFDLNFDSSFNEIIMKIDAFKNYLFSKNRMGEPNITLIPKDLYDKYHFLFKQNNDFIQHNFIEHQDKILCLYLKNGNFDNTFLVLTDTELINSRFLKIRNIIKKLNGENIDRKINYVIFCGGKQNKYSVGYLKIK